MEPNCVYSLMVDTKLQHK